MIFIARQEAFECEHCKNNVAPLVTGSYRNHCPYCLYSKHVDESGPGDRSAECQGLMKPIGIDQKSGTGFIVIHKCTTCNKQIPNKAADDDDLSSFTMEMPESLL